jgi:hypothetical protein
MRDIGRAPQQSGRPPARNPKGRMILRRVFVEGLARSAATRFAHLLLTPQNPLGAALL